MIFKRNIEKRVDNGKKNKTLNDKTQKVKKLKDLYENTKIPLNSKQWCFILSEVVHSTPFNETMCFILIKKREIKSMLFW